MEKSGYIEQATPVDVIGFTSALRHFVFTKSFTYTLKVFTSDANLQMYKDFKGTSTSHPNFWHAKQSQNQSKGMPLLVLRRAYGIGIGDTSYMRIYQCLPSPESRDRLFHKADELLFAEVTKRAFASYIRFRLKFESVEVVLILHRRYPIADFRVGDKRFRFVRDRSFFEPAGYFSSDLFLLDRDQTSLVDGLTSDLKVHKSNELLGSSVRNFLAPFSFKPLADFMSPHQLGQLVNTIFPRIGTDHRDCSLSLVSNGVCDFDDNRTVEFEAIVIICASLVINLHDDEMRRARRNKRF